MTAINRLLNNHATQPAPRFELVASSALDAGDYSATPIISGCLYRGQPAVIGGIFKSCKTLVATDAAISIATGRKFLNTFAVTQPMSIVFFSGEGGPAVTQEYGRRIAASKGANLRSADNLYWCFSIPKLEKVDDLGEIQRIHDDTGAEVMIFDNLMLALSGDDAGNVFKMGHIIGNAIRVCSERGITPVFIHHFKRTRPTDDRYAPGELLDLTQAGAAEIAGQWMLLTRREAYDPDQPGEHRLWLNIGGRLGHGCLHAVDIHEGRRGSPEGRRWDVSVMRPSDARRAAMVAQRAGRDAAMAAKQEQHLAADRQAICRAAVALKSADTWHGLRSRCGVSSRRFPAAFASLVDDGTLKPADVSKGNGRIYPGWTINSDDTTPA